MKIMEIKSMTEKEHGFCPDCNVVMKVYKIIDEKTAIVKCIRCKRNFKVTYDERHFPDNIKQFNWGAFLIGGIWGFFNGSPGYASLCLLLNFLSSISYLGIIFGLSSFVFQLFGGINGNRKAWLAKDWASFEVFEKTQKDWDIIAWMWTIAVIIVVLIIYFSF